MPAPITESQYAVRDYAITLGEQLAQDLRLCDILARLWTSCVENIVGALLAKPQLSLRSDQVTAKFPLGERNLLEIAVGHHAWHYIGLRSNAHWVGQMARLDEAQQRRVLAQICLIKRLASRRGCYGNRGRLPGLSLNSRRFERLIITQALAGSQRPLVDAMTKVASANHPAAIGAYMVIPTTILTELGFAEHDVAATTRVGEQAVYDETWRTLRALATAILEGAIAYEDELAHGE